MVQNPSKIDREHFINTLQSMHVMLGMADPAPGFAVSLSVDLRKLICDKTQKKKQLITRVLPDFKLPRTATIQPAPKLPGLTLTSEFQMPFSLFNGRCKFPVLLGEPLDLEDWLDQKVLSVASRELTIRSIIQFIGNKEGAHASDLHGDEQKDPAMLLRNNLNVRHPIIFGLAEFVYASITRDENAREIVPDLKPYNLG